LSLELEEKVMTKNTRRFAAALSLTLALAGSPAAFAAGRGADDRAPIVKIMKRILRFIGISVTAEPTMPIPAPTTSTPNP
jgi:hypothetical protein